MPDSKKKGIMGGKEPKLPALDVLGSLPEKARQLSTPQGGDSLPNASLIYGIGSAVLFGFSFYSLFTGSWLTAFLVLLPALALLGFALHYLRYPDHLK